MWLSMSYWVNVFLILSNWLPEKFPVLINNVWNNEYLLFKSLKQIVKKCLKKAYVT